MGNHNIETVLQKSKNYIESDDSIKIGQVKLSLSSVEGII